MQVHTHEVAKRLAERGWDVTVVTADATATLPPRERIDGVSVLRVRAWPRGRDYFFAPGIDRVVRSGDWDLVHCQGYHTLVPPIAMTAALRAGIPYVLTFHSGGHSSRSRNALRRSQWWALRPLLARARRLIGVARFEARMFQHALRLPRALFTVVPNGGDLVGTIDVDTRVRGLVVSLGRVERYKGHQRVVSALPYVLEQRPDVKLVVVGYGPYEDELRRLAARLGCGHRVEIRAFDPSQRGAFAKFISQAELVTMLSEYEAHPIAATEALYLGRPLLVLRSSGLAELVDDGLARGVEPGASDADVAAAILEQLRKPLVPERNRVPTWEQTTNALVAVYESALGRELQASAET
jgi:glycosyltransferase involved in cell wall biosynthesis